MKTFTINKQKYNVTDSIIKEYIESPDKFLTIYDDMVSHDIDISIAQIDDSKTLSMQFERIESYIEQQAGGQIVFP